MKNETVDVTGATYLLLTMLLAKMFTLNPRMLATKVGTAAWLVTLLAALVAWPGYLCLSAVLRRFPGQSLGQISLRVLGKPLGMLFGLIYVGYFVYLAGLFMRAFEASFRIAVLPRTPASGLMIPFALAVTYLAMQGLEVICRIMAVLFPILVALFLLMAFGTFRVMEFHNLFPFFGQGIRQTLLFPFPESSVYSEVIVLGALAACLRVEDVHRVGARALWGGAFAMTAAFVMLEGVFPFPVISRLHFLMLDMARAILIGEFLQRIEAIFVILWFFFGSFKVTSALACGAVFFRDLAGLDDYRPLVPALTMIAYTVAFLPANTVVVALLDSYTIRTWSWTISFLMPAITLGVVAWRQRRGAVANALPG